MHKGANRGLSLFSPSGGVLYHLKAFRYKKNIWSPFLQSLEKELLQSPVFSEGDSLLILGSSAAYTLTDTFLKKFKNIICVDQDPLAPFLFKKNHPEISAEFVRVNLLDPIELKELLEEFSEHKILVSNFLGQLRAIFDGNKDQVVQALDDFLGALKQKSFCSYHDLFCTMTRPEKILFVWDLEKGSTLEKILAKIYPQKKEIEILDVYSSQLFQNFPRKLLLWEIKKNFFHFIEYVELSSTG